MESGTQRAASRLRGLLFTFDFSPFDCSDLRSANWDLRWRWGVGWGDLQPPIGIVCQSESCWQVKVFAS